MLHAPWTNMRQNHLAHCMQGMTCLAANSSVKWASHEAYVCRVKPTLGTDEMIASSFEKSSESPVISGKRRLILSYSKERLKIILVFDEKSAIVSKVSPLFIKLPPWQASYCIGFRDMPWPEVAITGWLHSSLYSWKPCLAVWEGDCLHSGTTKEKRRRRN